VRGPLHPSWEATHQECARIDEALEAISVAEVDELIRRAILVRKRFTGLWEAEDYQAAAAALGGASRWPRAKRRPRRKARKSRRPHKNYRHRKPRLQLISPVLGCTVNLQVESSKVVRDTSFP
jgi:hypothetical protein